MTELFDEIAPLSRLLIGPGPVGADPCVLGVMSMPLLGQFAPQFTGDMNETMALFRQVFQTRDRVDFFDRRHRSRRQL